jgi:preprotein translocase subunit SecA
MKFSQLVVVASAGIAYGFVPSTHVTHSTKIVKSATHEQLIIQKPRSRVTRPTLSLQMGVIDGFKKLVGPSDSAAILENENDKVIKEYMERVEEVNALEDGLEKISDEGLVKKAGDLRTRLSSGASRESILVEAFAVAREATWRVLSMRHYDVQLMGGMALHDGRLAEMVTGEGKTLVALLPVFLNALSGEPAFVITTSDYLARRDGENIGQVFRFLGLSVGIVQNFQTERQREAAYSCDVTYVSNQELGFDFLRDNLATSQDQVVLRRSFAFCVVDEADSILVDEARTPLIISRKGNAPTDKYISCAEIAKNLKEGEHYEVDRKNTKVEMTPKGFKYAEQIVGKGLFELGDPWAFYIVNAVKAKELYARDSEYIIREDGSVAIVDSFSGRVLDGRRFTDGLQQSIEAKEGLAVSAETQTVAKVTYQNLFRLFPRLSGMTGTAFTEAQEFQEVYGLKVLPIPTALPVARRDNADAVFRTQEGKMKALLRNVLSSYDKGRPVLIGTTSVESSEELLKALQGVGVQAQVLNARPENVEREAEIIAQAGRKGAVTVATNMAGRGTDILLGGSASGLARVLAKQLMLVALGKTPSPSEADLAAIEVAEAAVAKAAEAKLGEDLESLSDFQRAIKESEIEREQSKSLTNAGVAPIQSDYDPDADDDEETDEDVLALPAITALCRSLGLWQPVQLRKSTELDLKRAVVSCLDDLSESATVLDVEDVVARAADNGPVSLPSVRLLRAALKAVIKEYKPVIEQEREQVKKLGGLYVVGTSRHESRRIDNQLRGRSGRQGDSGASRFFLSLEDDLFKVFGADKIASLMENFRVAEDMPIESDLVGQALDKVQIQVEDYYRANRQQVFKLDEVTNGQREQVYAARSGFLSADDATMAQTFEEYARKTLDEIYKAALSSTAGSQGGSVAAGGAGTGGAVDAAKLVSKALQFFPNMQLTEAQVVAAAAADVPALLHESLGQAIATKREQVDALSPWAFAAFFRYLALVQVDEAWCRHLSRLDLLKEEMVLQSFTADRDVMEVYKEKAAALYSGLMDDVRRNTVYSLFIWKPAAQ